MDGRPTSRRWSRWLDSLVTVVSLIAAGAVLYETLHSQAGPTRVPKAQSPLPKEPVSIDGAELKGNLEATVALVVYSDFECPFCGRFAKETWPQVFERYVSTNKVLVAFHNLPLEKLHPHALRAAAAAKCAGQLGSQFWPMHDAMFADPKTLDDESLTRRSQVLGLDRTQFTTCLDGDVLHGIAEEIRAASALGISGTPTFLIGTRRAKTVLVKTRLAGAQSIAKFAEAIDPLLPTAR